MPSELLSIEKNEKIASGVHLLMLPGAAAPARAGQFYMVRPEHAGVLLPRPISVCDFRGNVLTLAVQAVGRGTDELVRLRPGDRVRLTGPLGNGFAPEALSGPVALVGGGIGVAPLLYTAGVLKDMGLAADAFLGFRDEVFLLGEFAPRVGELAVATESGREGHKGLVTALLDPARYAAVLCCGPTPMMRAVRELCAAAGTPVYVSLETRMACGVGACLTCTCADKDGRYRRTCADGPVFRGEEIEL